MREKAANLGSLRNTLLRIKSDTVQQLIWTTNSIVKVFSQILLNVRYFQ